MFNTMIGKYIPLNSRLHRMNSISKIVCLLLFLIMLFIDDYILLGLLTLLTLIMMISSRVPFKLYLRSISGLKYLIIFLFLITLIFNESWYIMLTSIVRIILGVIYTMVIAYTTSKSEINYGLEKVFYPLRFIKIPVKQMSLTLTLALRFIPTVFEQTEKIMKSQASRGIDFNHVNLKGKIIALSSMIVPMFVLSSRKADVVADIMEVRLYDQGGRRTNYRFKKWHGIDDNLIVLHFGILLYFVLRMILS